MTEQFTCIEVILGGLFIILGFLTFKFPGIIKQWRYASEAERKNIDIKGLQKVSGYAMIVTGVALMIVGVVNYFVEGTWSIYALIVILLAMSGCMVGVARRYDKNPGSKRKQIIGIVTLVVSMIVVVGLLAWGKQENEIRVVSNQLEITGMYGEKIDLNTIDTVYVRSLNELPTIKMRTNGYADGKVLKGYFRLEDWGRCKLVVHDVWGKVIVLKQGDRHIIFNLYDEQSTRRIYLQLIAD